MREALRAIAGQRASYRATVRRFGTKPAWRGPEQTILFRDVFDAATGRAVCDHLWFTMNEQFKRLDLKAGEEVVFTATAAAYLKGYAGDGEGAVSVDYCLKYPRNARRNVDRGVTGLPLFQ